MEAMETSYILKWLLYYLSFASKSQHQLHSLKFERKLENKHSEEKKSFFRKNLQKLLIGAGKKDVQFGATTFSIIKLSIMTLNITIINTKVIINDTQCNCNVCHYEVL